MTPHAPAQPLIVCAIGSPALSCDEAAPADDCEVVDKIHPITAQFTWTR